MLIALEVNSKEQLQDHCKIIRRCGSQAKGGTPVRAKVGNRTADCRSPLRPNSRRFPSGQCRLWKLLGLNWLHLYINYLLL